MFAEGVLRPLEPSPEKRLKLEQTAEQYLREVLAKRQPPAAPVRE
jgi:hypothetical protein